MNMEQKQSIAWHVPNLLSICIDSVADGEMSGEIYHCYKKEPLKFSNIIRMIETADKFFDQIKFPQSATQIRSFEKKRTNHGSCTGKGLYTPGSVGKTRCERHILLNVKYRQNSSWQGVIQWVEGDLTYSFSSVLELLKILSNVMQ